VTLLRELGSGFALSTGLKGSRYDTGAGATATGLGTLGLERYWAAYRIAWTGYVAAVERSWSLSNRIALDRFYGEENRIGIALAAGRELESSGARVLSTPVLGASVGGRHGLGGGWAVTYEGSLQRQGEYYTRAGGRLGLRRRF